MKVLTYTRPNSWLIAKRVPSENSFGLFVAGLLIRICRLILGNATRDYGGGRDDCMLR